MSSDKKERRAFYGSRDAPDKVRTSMDSGNPSYHTVDAPIKTRSKPNATESNSSES